MIEIAEAVWNYPERTLSYSTGQPPNTELALIAQAVWSYAERSVIVQTGLIGSGSAELLVIRSEIGSGGVYCSGLSNQNQNHFEIASGSLTVGGVGLVLVEQIGRAHV